MSAVLEAIKPTEYQPTVGQIAHEFRRIGGTRCGPYAAVIVGVADYTTCKHPVVDACVFPHRASPTGTVHVGIVLLDAQDAEFLGCVDSVWVEWPKLVQHQSRPLAKPIDRTNQWPRVIQLDGVKCLAEITSAPLHVGIPVCRRTGEGREMVIVGERNANGFYDCYDGSDKYLLRGDEIAVIVAKLKPESEAGEEKAAEVTAAKGHE